MHVAALIRGAPAPAAIDRMVAELDEGAKRPQKFSRERRTNKDQDPFHINERNRVFNKKVARSFDKYTIEIRQNLERGSAL